MSQLGERLRQLRGDQTLGDIERALGIARIVISRYEKGQRVPEPHMLKKLAKHYDVPYKELRKLHIDELYSDAEEREIVLEWAKQILENR